MRTCLCAEELSRDPDLEAARALLRAYRPHSQEQARTQARMLAFIDEHPLDAHLRTQLTGHLTASALVLDASGTRALLTHHRKLNRWLQLGGHCDGDANLALAALREAQEESGIADLRIEPLPIDLDIHSIPARRDEPEHLHLDTRFLVHAPAGAVESLSEESHALAWVSVDDLEKLSTDESVRRLFRLAFR
jgi:8-oxo-dGTP pyrophosphatase MutT (NUDIX family)